MSKVLVSVFAAALAGSCQQKSGNTEVSKDTVAVPSAHATTVADVPSVPGLDTSILTPREKREWNGYVNEFTSPCSDVPVSIAVCLTEKRNCSKCLPAAKSILRGVREGMSRDQIQDDYRNRFDPSRIKSVPIDGSPFRGPESAPVTIVEFADFECPYCAVFAPTLEKAWEEHKDQVRVVYKFMPLPGHPHGEPAARAGIAAFKYDKFWEMNKQLFSHREHLEQSDLDLYAKELGINVDKFRAAMQSKEATERIEKDRKLADAIGVKGTPTVYINGREFNVHQSLDEWITAEIAMSGATTTTAATSSAAPSASVKK